MQERRTLQVLAATIVTWLSRYVSNEGNADVIRVNLKEIDAVDKQ